MASCHLNKHLHFQSREQIKISLWNDHFVEYGRTVCMFRTEKIRKLVAMGIPESLRGRLWLLFSGRFWCVQTFCSLWNRFLIGLPVSSMSGLFLSTTIRDFGAPG